MGRVIKQLLSGIISLGLVYFGFIMDVSVGTSVVKWFMYFMYTLGAFAGVTLVILWAFGYMKSQILEPYMKHTEGIGLQMIISLSVFLLIVYSGNMVLLCLWLISMVSHYFFVNEAIKYKKWENGSNHK
jgi:hypothetical protein